MPRCKYCREGTSMGNGGIQCDCAELKKLEDRIIKKAYREGPTVVLETHDGIVVRLRSN